MWNYFRLENEHLNNVGKFRAVRDISIGPMRPTDISGPEGAMRLMDEADEDEEDNMLMMKNLKSSFKL